MEYWVITRVGEKPHGPYEVDEVLNLPLSPESLIWHTGMSEWQVATAFDEFKCLFEDEASDEEADDNSLSPSSVAETQSINEDDVEAEQAENTTNDGEETTAATEDSESIGVIPPPIPAAYAVPPVPAMSNPAEGKQPAIPPQITLPQMPQQTEAVPECPPTYLVWSIIFTIVCCMPFGVAGIIFAILTKTRYNKGNYKGAKKASEIAEWMCILAFTFGLVYLPVRLFSL